MGGIAMAAAALMPGVITLSGQTVSGFSDAFIEVRADGNVYEFETDPGVFVQIDTATDWCRPVAVASQFEVRFTQNSGDAPNVGTLNTWQTLDTDRAIGYSSTTGSGEFLVEIRYGGIVLASGVYTCTATG